MWYLNNTRVTTRLLDADSDSWSFVPSTPGTYHIFVKASSEWSVGDIVKSETLNVTFCTLLYETQYAFSVESNSTVSALSYGSDNRTLSFMVTGMEETLGYAKVNVDKRLVPNVELLKVYVGEVEHNYTATEEADSLIIMFTYSHSVHQVEIELDYTIAELQTPFLLLGLVAASLLLVATRRRVRS